MPSNGLSLYILSRFKISPEASQIEVIAPVTSWNDTFSAETPPKIIGFVYSNNNRVYLLFPEKPTTIPVGYKLAFYFTIIVQEVLFEIK